MTEFNDLGVYSYVFIHEEFIGTIFVSLSVQRNPRWRPIQIFHEIRTLNLLQIYIKPVKINNFLLICIFKCTKRLLERFSNFYRLDEIQDGGHFGYFSKFVLISAINLHETDQIQGFDIHI